MATNISFSTYGFMNGILILSEENWRRFFKPFITDSVQSGLATIEGANMTVYVSAGECRCGAVMGILDEMIALDIANGDSTYNRIDSVIVQYTYGEPSTLAVAIIQGTPSANPVPPTLTKVYDTLWQMEIAQILVPSGATSSSEFTITDKRVIYESIESIIDDNTESEERVWSSQKTHEEIVSLSSEIYDSLNTKADAITRTASGSLVHITDAGAYPVDSLAVGIDPVQDLHGYDSPWPAGGGVNVMPTITPGTYSAGGITAVVGSDGTITVTGQKNVADSVRIIFPDYSENFTFPNNYYFHYRNSYASYDISFNCGGTNSAIGPVNRIFQRSEGTPSKAVNLWFAASVTEQLNFTLRPSIEATSSVTDWTPYSNICPISGHSNAVVTRTVKNLLPPCPASDTSDHGIRVVSDGNGYYTVSGTADGNVGIDLYLSEEITLPDANVYLHLRNTAQYTNAVFVLRARGGTQLINTNYNPVNKITEAYNLNGTVCDRIRFYVASGGTVNFTVQPSLEFTNATTSYEPYTGTSVTIDLNGTRYGGQLDALTGVMTVDRAIYAFDGTESLTYSNSGGIVGVYGRFVDITDKAVSVNYGLSSHYKYVSITNLQNRNYGELAYYLANQRTDPRFFFGDSNNVMGSKDAFLTYFAQQYANGTPVTIVYPLATPLTVQLTPATMSMLLGENNLWSDTGDVLNLTYRTDTKKYIEQKVADTNRKTCEMMTIVTDKMIAPDNLIVGDLVIVNADLYKVINSNIASGEAMVIGTNVIKITLAEYIQSLI